MKPEFFASIRSGTLERTPIFIGQGTVTEGSFVAHLLQAYPHSRHILLADKHIYKLYGEPLAAQLRAAGVALAVALVTSKESSKSVGVYSRLISQILKEGIDKNSHILTLGGGVLNNLGGFLAATLYRGIGLIHLPSSLMAQLDAAIDVRQAINHPLGKNLIGCYYSPRAVVVDPLLLQTLPLRQLRSGIAEAVKHSLTQSSTFFRFLLENAHQIREPAFLEKVLRKTIRLKLSLINARDSSRHGEFLLQYGHCIGHALETASNSTLLHGEAISIGMAISADIAFAMRLCEPKLIEDHRLILSRYSLPTLIPRDVSIPTVLKAISYDKNVRRRTPQLALLRDVGQVYKFTEGSFAYVNSALLQNSLIKNKEGTVSKAMRKETAT
jgi:3-dehydroquinate synthase